ncbi:MAG: response regulator transcription factor [Acidobacteria bacterium]|nr:response regulator transcription factor [Acidobacteriota bacterium]
MSRPRVLIAEDHELLAEAFQKLLEAEVEVVGRVLDGRALLEEAPRLKPDIVVLDISMPKLNGLEAGEQLKKIMPDVKLIFLTIHEDPDLAVEAFRLGASGYLLKGSAASELFQAVQEVSRGRTYVTPLIAEGMIESFARDPERRKVSKLTPRQREILQLLAEGNSMKEVAAILNIAPRTVAFHKYRMMEMLGLKSNAELLRLAIKEQIVD